MEQTTASGILSTAATVFVTVGVGMIQTDFIKGAASILVGCAIYVGTEILKKYGYDVGSVINGGR
ncbi:MAG: hypothetical protein WC788_03770 [Candidatus Paceibacterota bacterium]|jgi:hypothetical protein